MSRTGPDRTPQRLLLVSADIGEGHNATGRAIEEAAHRLWPECRVDWLDTLELMGPGVGPLFRWIYVRNVQSTPWLYDLFYNALWRQRWFADASRRFVGAWSGPPLRRAIARLNPDMIVSTYPMGTAGLDRLRRQGELDLPVSAVVSDFCPHPFWVYPEIDMHYVMSRASQDALYRAQPDARAAVCVPPVVPGFEPEDRHAARRRTQLPEAGFHVLVSCGSFGFGAVERAVDTALDVDDVDHVIVACGRNEQLRRRITERVHRRGPRAVEKVSALGWFEDMPGLTAAADVVITNAGGATALEAMACGRPVIMFEPIAGHGRGNADIMARSGLAELCSDTSALADTLGELSGDPGRLARLQQRVLDHARSADFTEQVRELGGLARHHGRRRLRATDAFFAQAETSNVPQQTGAILTLEGARTSESSQDWAQHLAKLIEHRGPRLPMLRTMLVRRRARRPVWQGVRELDPWRHLEHRDVVTPHEFHECIREFFSGPVPTDRPPWRIMLLRRDEEVRLLAKLHHSLGDGIAVTDTLVRLLRDSEPADNARAGETLDSAPTTPAVRDRIRSAVRRSATLARGFVGLAGSGFAPSSALDGKSTATRRFGAVELSAAKVRAGARAHGIPRSVLLIGLVAEALHRTLDEQRGTAPGQRVRAMVPRTTRAVHENPTGESFGNHTVAVAVDLPAGPMSPNERLATVARELFATQHTGQPHAAGLAMAALGLLPHPVQRWTVRRIYRHHFFNAIVSAMPGSAGPPHVWGALVAGVIPVLPLAPGVGLGVGMINWGEMVGIGITTDARLGALAERLQHHVQAAFDDLQDATSGDRHS